MDSEIKRLQWIDVLKFFGIVAVMFGHIYTGIPVLDWLYTFHVPLFFIAGGVVYRPRKIADDVKRRAFRIIVPYLIFGFIILLYYNFLERPYRDVNVSLADGLLGLVIGDMEHLEFHSHLWFLPCYFMTTVVYNILYKLIKPLGCGIVCGAASLIYVLLPIPSLPWGIDRMLGFLGLFALGNLFAARKLTDKAERLPLPAKLAAAAVLIALSVVLSALRLTSGIMWIVCAVIGTAGFAALSMAAEKASVLAATGKMTLVILCIHGPVYRVLIKLTSMALDIPPDNLRGNIFAALAVTAVTLTVCCAVYMLLAKLLPWSIGITPKKSLSGPDSARKEKS